MQTDELFGFFQGNLEKDFGFSDDQTIESLKLCMSELQRVNLDLPPPPIDSSEFPSRPFGLFVPPSVEQIIGRRTLESETELLRGRRATHLHMTGHRMSISIPPDGGPAFVEDLHSREQSSRNNLTHALSNSAVQTPAQVREVQLKTIGEITSHGVNSRMKADTSQSTESTKKISSVTNPVTTRTNSGRRLVASNQLISNSGANENDLSRTTTQKVQMIPDRTKSATDNRSKLAKRGQSYTDSSLSAAPQEYGATIRF